MSTIVSGSPAPARAAEQAAAADKFGTFAIAFSITAPIVYFASELLNLPLFTYHPATNRFDFGFAPGRSGEGPAMYWYGWTATMLIGATAAGGLATLLPSAVTRRMPLALIWLLPILAMIPLAWALGPYWSKG